MEPQAVVVMTLSAFTLGLVLGLILTIFVARRYATLIENQALVMNNILGIQYGNTQAQTQVQSPEAGLPPSEWPQDVDLRNDEIEAVIEGLD